MTFYDDPSMVCALRHIKEFKTAGERRKFLDEYFDAMPDDPRDSWCCLLCRDTGFVAVYHPSVVIAATQGKLVKWWKTVTVRCTCERAEHVAGKTKQGNIVPIYGEVWHFRKNDPDGQAKCHVFDVQTLRDEPGEQQLPAGDRT